MSNILTRLKNLEENLNKTKKPKSAKICSDAHDEIKMLKKLIREKSEEDKNKDLFSSIFGNTFK